MTTALEIIDSAVKIGLGAVVSGVATYFVTRKNHQHELLKATREARRALIRSVARLLEESTTYINQATYGIQQGQAEAVAGARQLIDALNKLGEAKSLAIFLGAEQLVAAITELRAAVVALAHYVGPDAAGRDSQVINRLLVKTNESSPTIHSELASAYAELAGDA